MVYVKRDFSFIVNFKGMTSSFQFFFKTYFSEGLTG